MRNSKELVPGDIIALGLGDLAPVDVKIISGKISVDQSTLTGSLPVNIEKSEIVYSSSTAP